MQNNYVNYSEATSCFLDVRDRLNFDLATAGDDAWIGLIVTLLTKGHCDLHSLLREAARITDFDCQDKLIQTLAEYKVGGDSKGFWHLFGDEDYALNL